MSYLNQIGDKLQFQINILKNKLKKFFKKISLKAMFQNHFKFSREEIKPED